MNHKLTWGVLASSLVLAAGTPAEAQRRELQQVAADVRMLQEQTQQLQNALGALNDALKAINARIDDTQGATRKGFADQKLQSDQMAGDLRIVRERVDDSNVRITSLSQEVEALRLAIPAMAAPAAPTDPFAAGAPGTPGTVTPNGPSGPATVGGTTPSPVVPPSAAPPPVATGLSPQRLYDTAWADYTAGQWDLAIEGFNTYIRTFPRNDAADNAQYYIGEGYYADGQFAEAVDAFNRVISTYPRSDVMPNAYYKRGLVLERMNQPDRARESYDFAVKNFTDSDAGRLAKQRLDALNRRQQ
jgi:tol-pal system protein YbgF